jgi:hypothetical protein
VRTVRDEDYLPAAKLEKTLVPAVVAGIGWGNLASARDELLRLAGHQGGAAVVQLRAELDELRPTGLWRGTVRCHLREHGFVQQGNESFAETMARALAISTHELRSHLMRSERRCWSGSQARNS